ncbi:MAG: DUF222 domain-containing protein [Solirubrobacteraceae bacterium]|nr:DUF222 domain-containing protein [Solirubrobacteraceae bacterium]
MFDRPSTSTAVERVRSLTADLLTAHEGLENDEQRIDFVRALEELKCAASGSQAAATADFSKSQLDKQVAAGVRKERLGVGIASQVALARRVSPAQGQRLTGFATVVRREMPFTDEALRRGRITERAALALVQETACLELPDRAEVDRRIAGDLDAVEQLSERQVIREARAAVAELDPAAVAERRRRAEADRHVTTRPAPDTMMWLGSLLPVKDGVAVWAVLSREADRARAAGDQRSRGQIMADTLRDRVLDGGAEADAPALMINVIVPDSVLLGDEDGTGWVQDYGPVPGDLLREWIAQNAEDGVDQWVRRLYASPTTGEVVAMDSKARRFEGKLAEFLRLRDQECRTDNCHGLIRHLDHVQRQADGGPTSATNGQGTCETCNYAKEAPGWSARFIRGPDGEHVVETVTPTGHRYTSRPPRWKVQERGLRVEIFRPAA